VGGRSRRWTHSTCATPATESAHGYAFESRSGELLLAGSVAIGPVGGTGEALADAGRLIAGGESFRVRTRGGARSRRGPPVALADRGDGRRAQGPAPVSLDVAQMGIRVRAAGRRPGASSSPTSGLERARLPCARGRRLGRVDRPRALRPLRGLPLLVLPVESPGRLARRSTWVGHSGVLDSRAGPWAQLREVTPGPCSRHGFSSPKIAT